MTQCKEGSQRDGLLLDSSEELYKWFTDQVSDWARVIRRWGGGGWLLQDASQSISMTMVYNRQPYWYPGVVSSYNSFLPSVVSWQPLVAKGYIPHAKPIGYDCTEHCREILTTSCWSCDHILLVMWPHHVKCCHTSPLFPIRWCEIFTWSSPWTLHQRGLRIEQPPLPPCLTGLSCSYFIT